MRYPEPGEEAEEDAPGMLQLGLALRFGGIGQHMCRYVVYIIVYIYILCVYICIYYVCMYVCIYIYVETDYLFIFYMCLYNIF